MIPNRQNFYNTASDEILSSILPHRDLWGTGADLLAKSYVEIAGILSTQITLEIGAHEATFSQKIKARYGDAVTAFAFEASPATFARYKQDVSRHGIKYINAALSNINGSLPFFEYRESNDTDESPLEFSSLYIRDPERTSGAKKSEVSVKSLTGDSFIRSQCPDAKNIALWIDVEGAQQEVLEGFSETFEGKRVSSVFIEVESVPHWPKQKMLATGVIAKMAEMGFSPLLRDTNYSPQQFNIIFIRNDCLGEPVYTVAESYIQQCRSLAESYKTALVKMREKDDANNETPAS